jgi:hypothetical protein
MSRYVNKKSGQARTSASRGTRVRKQSSRSRSGGQGDRTPPAFSATAVPAYLKQLDKSVRGEFAGARTLTTLLASVEPLSREERMLIVRQALILIEQNYAHLPLKRAMHAIDPVQRLKLLLQELETNHDPFDTDIAFHNELTDIFTSLRDLHTNYLLPDPYAGMTAFLPFMVEECFVPQGDARYTHGCAQPDDHAGLASKYLVTHIVDGFKHETFKQGVEVLYWNGMPIERAVRNNAQRYAGSNREARHARGVQTLTTRALKVALPPDDEWVIVGYRTLSGVDKEIRFDWVANPIDTMDDDGQVSTSRAMAASVGVDLHQQLVQRVRTSLFAPKAKKRSSDVRQKIARGEALEELESSMPQVLEARKVRTTSGTFGYVRIRTFMVDPVELINEFVRLVSALPKSGLIIDVRGNGGGVINSGEFLLQLLTPKRIEPEPVQFINTPLNLRICQGNGLTSPFANLTEWRESMQQALRTGATFSAGFPISSPEACNAIGQRYFGPVVLITDALCYSTTDIFAAGFQDHGIGKIIGTNANTGAGGANVWQHQHFVDFSLSGPEPVYETLPRGAGMRVSMRRTLRVGLRSGTPVEDLGVVPDCHHALTPRDVIGNKLLGDNYDLTNRAGELLRQMPVREMTVRALGVSGRKARLRVTTRGMSRIDIYADDRPIDSLERIERSVDLDVHVRSGSEVIELRGFDGEELAGRYRVTWQEIAQTAPTLGRPKKKATRARAATRRRPGRGRAAGARTPNVGDDMRAAAEASPMAFGGPALAADTPATATAVPPWRAAESLLVLRQQVNAMAPGRRKTSDGLVGDAAHALRTSDHNPWVRDNGMGVVTACDITHDPQGGCDAGRIAEAIRTGQDARVKYIIWNRQIANSESIGGHPPWTWRPYTGANPHTKHVHISVKPDKALYDEKMTWPI